MSVPDKVYEERVKPGRLEYTKALVRSFRDLTESVRIMYGNSCTDVPLCG